MQQSKEEQLEIIQEELQKAIDTFQLSTNVAYFLKSKRTDI